MPLNRPTKRLLAISAIAVLAVGASFAILPKSQESNPQHEIGVKKPLASDNLHTESNMQRNDDVANAPNPATLTLSNYRSDEFGFEFRYPAEVGIEGRTLLSGNTARKIPYLLVASFCTS